MCKKVEPLLNQMESNNLQLPQELVYAGEARGKKKSSDILKQTSGWHKII
jgi:hypothetical protein